MATKVIEVESGKLTVYPCDYDSYLYMKLKKLDNASPFAVLTHGFKGKKEPATAKSQGALRGLTL